MGIKKYIVREGFVVMLKVQKQDGGFVERAYQGGEELALDDGDAALHTHKLEFALQKDRDVALETEKKAAIKSAAQQSPAELVGALIAALTQAQAAAGVAPAQASAQAPATA